jgi:hypothetical protein
MLLLDSTGFYDKFENYNTILELSSRWMEHYNFMLSVPWNEEWENKTYQDELRQNRFYDV